MYKQTIGKFFGVAASVLVVGNAKGGSDTIDCPWELHTAPNPAGYNILYGIDALASDDIWTVGSRNTSSGTLNYAAHWDGDAWTHVPPIQPSGTTGFQFLWDVLAIGPGDAIAVGAYSPGSGSGQATAMRWSGSGWSLMDTPTYTGGGGFYCIGRLGDDVWVGGHKYSELPPPAAADYPLSARLDGDSWDIVFMPPLAETGGRSTHYVMAISGAASDDGWAVGRAQQVGTDGFGPVAMMVRWDGSAWTQYDLFPILSSTAFSGLEDLLVFSTDNAWAVGHDYAGGTIPLILHWDGSTWSNVELPDIGMTAELRAIHGRAPDDIYAAGTKAGADGFPHGFMLHYNGSTWVEVPDERIGDFGQWYRGLEAVGDQLWAVGQSNNISPGFTQRQEMCGASCAADLTGEGDLTFADVQEFLALFSAGDTTADFNADGTLNFFDVADFLEAFSMGCP